MAISTISDKIGGPIGRKGYYSPRFNVVRLKIVFHFT